MIIKLALVSAALVVLPACPLVDAEADVSEVCVTYRDLPLDIPAASGTFETSFAIDDLSAIKPITDLGSSISFVRASVRASNNHDNLGFISSARVDISSGDPMSRLPRITAFSCDGDCAAAGNLELTAPDQHDAIEYVKSNSLLVDLQVSGSTQARPLEVDVDVCMSGSAKYSF